MAARSAIWSLAMAAGLVALPGAPARADLGTFLLGSKINADGVDATYRKGNQIRAYATVSRNLTVSEARNRAVLRIAQMTKDKGYERFAIVKISDCGTMMMHGIPVYHSCRLLAQMVGPAEEAKPEKGHKVVYVDVATVVDDMEREDLRANMMDNGRGLAEAVDQARADANAPQRD